MLRETSQTPEITTKITTSVVSIDDEQATLPKTGFVGDEIETQNESTSTYSVEAHQREKETAFDSQTQS